MIIMFNTDNDAFNGNKEYEIARILLHLVKKIKDGVTGGKIMDINGNNIGYFEI